MGWAKRVLIKERRLARWLVSTRADVFGRRVRPEIGRWGVISASTASKRPETGERTWLVIK